MKRAIGLLSVVAVATLVDRSGRTGGATTATIVLDNYDCPNVANIHATSGGGLWLDSGIRAGAAADHHRHQYGDQGQFTDRGLAGGRLDDIFSLSNHVITGGPYPGNTTYDGLFYAGGGQPVQIPGGTRPARINFGSTPGPAAT